MKYVIVDVIFWLLINVLFIVWFYFAPLFRVTPKHQDGYAQHAELEASLASSTKQGYIKVSGKFTSCFTSFFGGLQNNSDIRIAFGVEVLTTVWPGLLTDMES